MCETEEAMSFGWGTGTSVPGPVGGQSFLATSLIYALIYTVCCSTCAYD